MVTRIANAFTTPASLTSAGSDRDVLTAQLYLGAFIPLMLLFCVLFWRCTRHAGTRSRRALPLMLAVQLLIATTVEPTLLFLLAAELALVLPLRTGLKWLAALIVSTLLHRLFAAFLAGAQDGTVLHLLFGLCIETGFYFLAFGVAQVAMLEQRGRVQLSAANAELKATQYLLADTIRSSERARIARDLHDHVGHHLTALNLHLDLAQRQAGGKILEMLTVSRELSQALLAEVRCVVSQERDDRPIDLAQALATLCAGIPRPAIRLAIETPLVIASAAVAHALFRCVKEGLSNAIRLANATLGTCAVHAHGDEIVARGSVDGRGSGGRPEGNGLRGMRERLAASNGTLVAGDQAGTGYAMEVRLPLSGEPR